MTDEVATATGQAEPTAAPDTTAVAEAPVSGGDASDDPFDLAMGEVYDRLMSQGEDAPQQVSDASAEEEPGQPENEAAETEDHGHDQPSIEPPNSWSAEDKAKWSAIPPDLQKVIAEREQQSHTQITSQGQYVAALKPVTDLIQQTPYRDQNPTELLTNLVKAQASLDRDPVEGLKWLAGSFGVDLRQLAGVQQDAEFDDVFRDPRFDQVSNVLDQTKQELAQARQEIQRLGGFVQSQQQTAYQAQQEETAKAIDSAAAELPYFSDLSKEITEEVAFLKSRDPSAKPATVLKKAYERALNNSPTYRQKVEQERQAKERAEAEKKIGKAKQIAATNVKSQTTTGRQVGDRWDDDAAMSAVYDSIVG